MPDWIMIVLFFVVVGAIYLVVSYIGNKIVDKGGDAIENAMKRKKNADSHRIDLAQISTIGS